MQSRGGATAIMSTLARRVLVALLLSSFLLLLSLLSSSLLPVIFVVVGGFEESESCRYPTCWSVSVASKIAVACAKYENFHLSNHIL